MIEFFDFEIDGISTQEALTPSSAVFYRFVKQLALILGNACWYDLSTYLADKMPLPTKPDHLRGTLMPGMCDLSLI